jgi:hypothetical protein
LSSDIVSYSCPHCRAELEPRFGDWEGWLRCPVCTRPSLPPEPVGSRLASDRLAVSNHDIVAQASALEPGHLMSRDGTPSAFAGRFAHSSPARLVFMTGFVFSLLLTLIAFLDQKPIRLAIFGFLSIAFFFLLLRTPRKRVAMWSSWPRREQEATAVKLDE